ncbi:MAG: hypothetical protein K1X68_00260 [Saprospiraceae bacterium]|nr:hypothetical protein [Saprospiraceae bacterium]HMX89687.1 hypothetical protein [Saprospiraceae bacterium]HNG70265.1 hypothetical protein [Saprospiraceae bacterium]
MRRRKSASAGTPAKRVKVGKKVYTREGCTKLKTSAKKKAAAVRKAGKLARVVKNAGGGYCVLTASKTTRKRKAVRRKR